MTTLSRLNRRALLFLARKFELPNDVEFSKIPQSLAAKINTNATEEDEKDVANEEKKAPAVNPAPPIADNKVPHVNAPPDQYTEEEVKKMTVTQLKEVAKTIGVSSKGNKQVLLKHVLGRIKLDARAVNRLSQALSAGSSPSSPPHHDHYRATFNSIDAHDKYYYEMKNPHHVMKWRPKFILSVLESAVINAFVIRRHYTATNLTDFCHELCQEILSDTWRCTNRSFFFVNQNAV